MGCALAWLSIVALVSVAQAADVEFPLDPILDEPAPSTLPAPMIQPEELPPDTQTDVFGAPSWNAPELMPKQFDWIQLTSGEWLKGELKVLRRDVLEFESDELDELSIDWDKIVSFHSSRIYTFGFSNRRMASGRSLITKDHVIVWSEKGEKLIYPRKELYSIVHGGKSWWSLWSGKLSFGATIRQGNTDQTDLNLTAALKRRSAFTRFSLDFRGSYGVIDGDVTVSNTKGDLGFDIFLTDRFYVRPAEVEIYRDHFQNIDIRYSPGVAIGYELVHNKYLEWSVEFGGVYRGTHFISTEPGQADVDRTGAITLRTDWEASLTRRLDLDGSYSASIGVADVEDTNQHADVTLSVELTDIFDIDLSFVWDRVGSPVATANDQIPDKDDFQLIAGVGIEF
jgi:hypothetical protein